MKKSIYPRKYEIVTQLYDIVNDKITADAWLKEVAEGEILSKEYYFEYLAQMKKINDEFSILNDEEKESNLNRFKMHVNDAKYPLHCLHIDIHHKYMKAFKPETRSEDDFKNLNFLYQELTKDYKNTLEENLFS